MSNKNHNTPPPSIRMRALTVLSISALALGLAACDKPATEKVNDQSTIGQKLDAAVAKTEQAAAEAKTDAAQALDQAKNKMDAEMPKVQASVENAGAKAMGVVDDTTITALVSAGLVKDPDLSAIKIDVDTKAGVVTLSGTAPTTMAKERATDIAKGIQGVSTVNNNLMVKAG